MTRFELVTSSLPRKRSTPELHRLVKERETRFELATFSLEGWRSTNWATPAILLKYVNQVWGEQDSNLWRWKPADLQSALVGRLSISPKNQQINMINIEPVEGFEPTTPRLQITCSGQLSYTGIFCSFSNKNYSLFNEVQIYDIFLFYQQKNVFFWKISY